MRVWAWMGGSWGQQGVSTTEELGSALHIPFGAAAELEADGADLTGRMAGTLHALEAGSFSYRHAQIIVDEVQSLRAVGNVPAAAGAEAPESIRILIQPHR